MTTNRLLERLPARDRAHVLAECTLVELAIAEVLAEPGDPIPHVYFPTGGFISLMVPMGDRGSIEVSVAGSEGMYGVPVALGVEVSPAHAMVQGAGSAWQMGSVRFRRQLAHIPRFRAGVDRYIYVLMSQLIQTAGCNRFHVVEQRVARWLLVTGDRAHASTFAITHEFLAYMLGVRRVGITEAAGRLQELGLIRYRRGIVTILDRKGLERASCPCYLSDIATYDRFIG